MRGRQFSLKTRGIAAGFLHLYLPLTLRVAKMQDVHSLLVFRSAAKLSLVHSFLLRGGGFRRRLFYARQFSLKTRGIAAGFLHLCLPLTLRVAKMQDVLSLLVPAELSLFLSFLLRGGGFRRRCFPQGTFRSKPTASPRVSCTYAFLSLCASRKYYFASRGECCYPRLPGDPTKCTFCGGPHSGFPPP